MSVTTIIVGAVIPMIALGIALLLVYRETEADFPPARHNHVPVIKQCDDAAACFAIGLELSGSLRRDRTSKSDSACSI
jgi:hypothetical protein